MKTIKLECSKNTSTKGYSIFIKRGLQLNFDTKTKAETHIRLLKKLLKDTANILCSIQSNLYSCYRDNYLFFENSTESKILKNLHQFDDRLTFVYKEYSKGSQSFVFLQIEKLIDLIENTIDILKDHAQRFKAFGMIQKIHSLKKQIYLLKSNFEIELTKLIININYRKSKTKVLKLIFKNIV